ncbi:MAG: hypothetical protein ACQES4_10875 [Bacillota bacterium]
MLINKEKWPDFIGKLAGKDLWAPRESDEGLRFGPVAEGEVPELEYTNTRVPPKEAVFPQTETLFQFKIGEEGLEEPQLEQNLVLLGVRPCDARAMTIIDKLFSWDENDPYYLKRRENAVLVGLACNEPGLNCFCTSVGGGPVATEGLDLLMVDLGEKYLLEEVTEKGSALLEEVKDLLE